MQAKSVAMLRRPCTQTKEREREMVREREKPKEGSPSRGPRHMNEEPLDGSNPTLSASEAASG